MKLYCQKICFQLHHVKIMKKDKNMGMCVYGYNLQLFLSLIDVEFLLSINLYQGLQSNIFSYVHTLYLINSTVHVHDLAQLC